MFASIQAPIIFQCFVKIWKANGSSVNLLASKGQTIAVSQIRQIALMKRPTRLLFPADALVSPQAIVTCAFYEKIKVHVAFQWKSTAGALSECVNAWWSRKFNFARKTCFSDFAPHFSRYRFHLGCSTFRLNGDCCIRT